LSSFSKNGVAYVAPVGSFTELEDGAYVYEATVSEIDTAGFGIIRVLDPLIIDFVYTWDVFDIGGGGTIIISNVSPVIPTPVLPQDAIQFDITASAGFALILPLISLNPFTTPELVHNFAGFEPLYAAGSTRVVITDGYRYTIRRQSGWYAQPNLIIYAVDSTGVALVGP
jgi:hypothetical protein